MSSCGRKYDGTCSCPACETERVMREKFGPPEELRAERAMIFARPTYPGAAAVAFARAEAAEAENEQLRRALAPGWTPTDAERMRFLQEVDAEVLRRTRELEDMKATWNREAVEALEKQNQAEELLVALTRTVWPHTFTKPELDMGASLYRRCPDCEETWEHPGPEYHAWYCRYVDVVEYIASRPDLAEAYSRYRYQDYDEAETKVREAETARRRQWVSPLREAAIDEAAK